MSRSGYSEDYGEDNPGLLDLYRHAVDRALQGKRGQAFLKEMLAALDALPNKRLIADQFEDADGDVCALGSVGKARGLDMSKLEPGDNDNVGKLFGIARSMAAEIQFENDDDFCCREKSPEARFARVREWVVSQIRQEDSNA
ncbi:hypothetical protein F9K50_07400 [bacterium]|nr:MAG: hypothetical protein F9K50_07400 [bacterium]